MAAAAPAASLCAYDALIDPAELQHVSRRTKKHMKIAKQKASTHRR